MKANVITLLLLSLTCVNAQAQTDDMYFMSSKKKAQKSTTTTAQVSTVTTYNNADDADYHTGKLRDVDEYNRRGASQIENTPSYRLVGDTLYVSSADQSVQSDVASYNEGYSDGYYDGLYDGDFTYTSRLARYRGFRFYDPFIWDISFGWYSPWYDPWYGYYSPYYHYGYWGWHNHGWYHPPYHGSHHIAPRPTVASRTLGQRSSSFNGRIGNGRI
ncbi:MAG: hypothetical protein J1F27_04935, partial [Prevotellaceae bacterium]|nr:hypothetical protein [Prevotellaceae bacterium]